jgi:two-component system, chemotaxis family, response regulator PixG
MIGADHSSADTPSGLLGVQSRLHLTGRLDIEANNQQWSLYLYMGRIIWATGGPHHVRRWYRNLSRHCPQIEAQAVTFNTPVRTQRWDYEILVSLVKAQKISVEQTVALTRSIVSDVLFDILQQEETRFVNFQIDNKDVLDASLALVNAQQVLDEVQPIWNEWRALGLVDHSPSLAPVIRQQEILQQQTSEKIYKTLVSIADGKRSLRDLAIMMKQDLVPLTRMLVPYFRKGFIGLVPIPDYPSPVAKSQDTAPISSMPSAPPPKTAPPSASGPLVLCVDDSKRECDTMEKIITGAGYRFIGVQDSVKALPTVLEHKPGVIFLDLVMPIASGYEVCAQIRRVELFKDTPIVILTSNDGIIDRVRAKVVGSTGFLSKPVEADKVLAVVQKYLGTVNRR